MHHDEDIQELWRWQVQRLLAECLHSPCETKEARLMFYLSSYRFMAGKGWQPARTMSAPPASTNQCLGA